MCLCFKRKYKKKKKALTKKCTPRLLKAIKKKEGEEEEEKSLYLSVNLISTKVLIGDTIFYMSFWRRDRHFTWSSESREGLLVCRARNVPSFLSYFKTLSFGSTSWIEPATFRSAVKRSTGWASPAACSICVLALVPIRFLSNWAIAVSCNFLHFLEFTHARTTWLPPGCLETTSMKSKPVNLCQSEKELK